MFKRVLSHFISISTFAVLVAPNFSWATSALDTASNQLVLVTSLGDSKLERRVEKRLERIFVQKTTQERKLKGNESQVSHLELKVIRKADQEKLNQALNDPRHLALFWVSHGSLSRPITRLKRNSKDSVGLSAEQRILDFRGDDVAPIFQKSHVGLQFLAVISCNAESILKEEGVLDSAQLEEDLDQKLATYLAHGKVRGPKEFKKALDAFFMLINREEGSIQDEELESSLVYQTASEITVRRSIPMATGGSLSSLRSQDLWKRSLRLMSQGKLIGVIPALSPGQTGEVTFRVSHQDPAYPVRVLELYTGQNIETQAEHIVFGEIEISVDQVPYQVFSDLNGVPFGKNRRVFVTTEPFR